MIIGGSNVKKATPVEKVGSLSLSLCVTPGVEAAKVLVEKSAAEPARGESLQYQPIALETLANIRATVPAEYATTVLVEIDQGDLDVAAAQAVEAGLPMTLHEDYDRIRINGFDYPSGAPCPDLRLDQLLESTPEKDGLWVVQMIGPPTPEWQTTLRSQGAVINAMPANTFVIRADRARAEALVRREGFHHVEPYQPAFKIQPRLAAAPGKVRAIVQLDAGRDLEDALTAIEAMVDRQFSRESRGALRSLLVELTPEQIRLLAQRPEVVWLEPYTRPGFSDERHAMVIAGQHDHDKPNSILTGLRYQDWLESKGFCAPGQTENCIAYSTRVAVFDSGLDRNICRVEVYSGQPDLYDENTGQCQWVDPGDTNSVLRHADLVDREDRFFCIEIEDDFGTLVNTCYSSSPFWHTAKYTFSDVYGHGSSVASLIAGDAIGGTGAIDSSGYLKGSGIAPDVNIVGAKIGGQFGPDDYERLVGKVFGIGTRFANNSWNEYADWDLLDPDDPNWPNFYHIVGYNTFSRMTDQLVRDGDGGYNDFDKGMTLVFSGGNFAWEENDPPYPDPNPDYLTIAPGNAKNIISVGASGGWEHQSENRGCCNQFAWIGEPSCADDDDISDVLFLSTRGTGTFQHRFKPDLVASGTRLQAAESREVNENASEYVCFGATSGAAPLATGSAVLVDAWFGYSAGYHPSPALIKAMLVAHAANLGPSPFGEGGIDRYTNQALPHSPSLAQGWGRLELDGLFSPPAATVIIDEDHRTSPPGPYDPPERRFRNSINTWTESYSVDQTSQDVIIVMAFTDAPGTPGAQYPHVNNIDVRVIDNNPPGSKWPTARYNGNFFQSPGPYSARVNFIGGFVSYTDAVNNVEVIRIPAGDLTDNDFTIEVVAQGLNDQAVPGLDGGVPNQDFALYVINAVAQGGSRGEMP